MASVHSLAFKAPLTTIEIRVGEQGAFEADPVELYFRGDYKAEVLTWLDANAPGWKLGYRATGYVTREPPIGVDERVSFISYELWIEFSQAQQQRAFLEFKAVLDTRHAKRAENYRATVAAGGMPCYSCGLPMVRERRNYSFRLADIEVNIEGQMGRWCDACGDHMLSSSQAKLQGMAVTAFWENTDIVSPRVDSKTSSTEYRKRTALPPRTRVLLKQGMDRVEVDACMRDAMHGTAQQQRDPA